VSARIEPGLARASIVFLLVAFLLAGASSAARSPRSDKKAPTTPARVRVTAATLSTVSLAWDPSRDNVRVTGYSVYLDGNVVATSSRAAATISDLACGRAYTFGIDSYDQAGNHSRLAWATVATAACPDRQSPTAPTGFRQQAATQSEVVLAWDPSTDNVGVVGYGVYRSGLLATQTTAPTVTLSGFVCGSVSEVVVDAVDAAGNRSEPRSTWVRTTACNDTQPPEKPVLSVGTATATSLVLNWQPGVDNVGVHHYNVLLNGAKVTQTTGLTWTYGGLTCDTAYALGLEVEDGAGNKSVPAATTVRTLACPASTADRTPPSQPGNLAVVAATNTTVTLGWTESKDNVGVVGYGVYVNGAGVQTKPQPGATVSGLACGTAYTLAVDAYDVAGNRSTKASLVGTTAPCADTQPPSTPANVAVISRTATSIALSWAASSDDVGVVGYGLYRGTTLASTTAVTTGIFSNLACGSTFTLAVDSYDAAGNRSGKSTITASTTVCPDISPPSAPTGLKTSNVTGTSLTLGWNASTDNVGVTGYDVYRNATKIASVTGTSSNQTGLACGTSYAFAVVSYDAAGNRSAQAQLTVTTTACAPTTAVVPPPPSGRWFAPDSPWNTPLTGNETLDPDSAAMIARESQRFDGIAWRSWSSGVFVATASTPKIAVRMAQWDTRSMLIPVPGNAKPAPGTDGHMSVIGPGPDGSGRTCLWDFWRAPKDANGNFDFSNPVAGGTQRQYLDESGWVKGAGDRGASSMVIGGLIRPSELRDAINTGGVIPHALAATVSNSRQMNGFPVLPSYTSDGSGVGTSYIPESARIRLNPNFDLSGLPAWQQAVGRTLKTYGMFVIDNGGGMSIFALDNTVPGSVDYGIAYPWGTTESPQLPLAMRQALQVIKIAPQTAQINDFLTSHPCGNRF
jgi:chitodextrinase